MTSLKPDEIDFKDQYDKADPTDDDNLNESVNELNRSIREQEELQEKLSRAEWSPINKDEIAKLGQWIAFNEKKQGLYVMRASKTILSILHRGFDKIKQDGRVIVLDQQSAEELYNPLRLIESDEGTYKVAFENESGALKDILSPGNKWLAPNAYLRIFGKKFIKDMGFDVDKPKSGTKNKIPKKRMEQIEQYIDEIVKHFAEGRLKEAGAIQKDLQLHNVNIASYYTDKYALGLDFRTIDDNRLHGSGRRLENTSEGIRLQ